jgi:hypothetical protein
MADINPSKLKAFASRGRPPPQESPGKASFDAEMGEQPPEGSPADANLDDGSNLSVDAMKHRLMEPHVGYMELEEKAGAMACGECRFMTEGRFCVNQAVLSYVSEDKGSCNLFMPLEGEPVSPDEWEGLKDVPDHTGGAEGRKEEEEEPEEEPEEEDEEEEEPEEPHGG